MSPNKKPAPVIIGLKTLDARAQVAPRKIVNTPQMPANKRVFTDEQWAELNQLTNIELMGRIGKGYQIISVLHRPDMINMTQKQADYYSSNLHYQIDLIKSILRHRGVNIS